MPFEDFTTYREDAETTALVQRYENMLNNNDSAYFDEEEFEIIINHYFERNKPAEALQAADCGNRQHPFSTEMKLQYAHALIQKGDAQQGLQMLEKIETEIINDPDVAFLKGLGHLRINDNTIGLALSFFEEAVRLTDEEDRVSFLTNIAVALMDVQEYDYALPFLQKAMDAEPDDLEIVNEIAFCQERLGNLAESLVYHEQYVKQEPFNDNVWYNLGTIYGRKEEYEKAIQAFLFAVTLNDQHSSAYYNLAATYVQQEKYEKAIATFRKFLEIEPDNAVAYLAIGECYDSLERYAEATDAYEKAVELDTDFADAHFALAIAYHRAHRLNEALTHAKAAIGLDTSYASYWAELGFLLLEHNHPQLALGAYEQAVSIDEKDVYSWLAMAEIVAESNIGKAIRILLQARGSNQGEATIDYHLAALYFTSGNLDECFVSLVRGLSLNFAQRSDFFERAPEALKHPGVNVLIETYTKVHRNNETKF